jgi:hypothetical protein
MEIMHAHGLQGGHRISGYLNRIGVTKHITGKECTDNGPRYEFYIPASFLLPVVSEKRNI